MHNLKPCPFCGSAAVELRECRVYVSTGWRVKCQTCKVATQGVYINTPVTRGDGTLDESTRYSSDQAAQIAVDIWNRRTKP